MNYLVCPQCQGELRHDQESFDCASCQIKYAVIDGIPQLVSSLGEHEASEQNFWDWHYNHEKVEKIKLLDFHENFLAPLRSLPEGSRVLEVACGSRADTLNLNQGGEVVLTDISNAALKKTRERGSWARLVLADAEHLPFGDATFDGVLTAASLHHAKNPSQALKEMWRVTKPGGWVIVAVEPASWPYAIIYPILKPLKSWIRKRRQRPFDSVADDETKGFSRRDLQKLFAAHDFEAVDIQPVKFFLELYDSGCRFLERVLRRGIEPNYGWQRAITRADSAVARVPILRRFPWHWTVVAKKKNPESP